ncbi:MAG: hypothetical protein ACT4NJ_01425 [Nitrosopumilaceae archaeon]
MQNNKIIIGSLLTIVVLTSLMVISIPFAEAHPHTGIVQTDNHTHEPITEIIPLNDGIGIEKTVLILHAPADNTLPWGFVEGKIANHVLDYPVIIQIYDEDGEATHFAQTNVEDDGSYEYRFRVRNVDNDKVINIFEGNYIVKIFKVVYLGTNSSQV